MAGSGVGAGSGGEVEERCWLWLLKVKNSMTGGSRGEWSRRSRLIEWWVPGGVVNAIEDVYVGDVVEEEGTKEMVEYESQRIGEVASGSE